MADPFTDQPDNHELDSTVPDIQTMKTQSTVAIDSIMLDNQSQASRIGTPDGSRTR